MADVLLDEEVEAPRRTISYGAARWTRARAHAKPELGPVTIVQRRLCHFKKKPDGKRGCARCGEPKKWVGHFGAPPSLNLTAKGNHFTYMNAKQAWCDILTHLLETSTLPRGLGRVYVEGTMCFHTRADRDQGNFRYLVEKALGDALRDGGWIEDDDWCRYEFGRLRMAYGRGQSYTELTLYPEWDTPDVVEILPEEPAVPGQLELVA